MPRFSPSLLFVLGLLPGVSGCLGAADDEAGVAAQALVGSGACASIAQIDSACPAHAAWRNHGKYVSCVAHYLDRRVERGDLSEEQKGALQSLAAQSEVGKVPGADGPSFGDALADEVFAGEGACDGADDGAAEDGPGDATPELPPAETLSPSAKTARGN